MAGEEPDQQPHSGEIPSPDVARTPSKTPFMSGDLDAELRALLDQIEKSAPAPKPLTRQQDIAAGLVRIGSALPGGPANIQSVDEKRYAEQEQAYRSTQAEVTKFRLTDALKRQAAQKQREADLEDEERKRRADEQVRIDAEKRKERGEALTAYGELQDLPDFQATADYNPDTITMKDVLRYKANWADRMKQKDPSMAGMSAQTIYNMLLMDMAIGRYMKGQKPSSINVGAEGGISAGFREPTEAGGPQKGIVTDDSPLTNQTARDLRRLGLSQYGPDGKR